MFRACLETLGVAPGAVRAVHVAEAIAREHARLARRNLEYVLYRDPSLMQRIPALQALRVLGPNPNPVVAIRQIDQTQQFIGPRPALGLVHAPHLQPEGHVLQHGKPRQQTGFL